MQLLPTELNRWGNSSLPWRRCFMTRANSLRCSSWLVSEGNAIEECAQNTSIPHPVPQHILFPSISKSRFDYCSGGAPQQTTFKRNDPSLPNKNRRPHLFLRLLSGLSLAAFIGNPSMSEGRDRVLPTPTTPPPTPTVFVNAPPSP
ncbi:hypothetical protein CDAR_58991 [Caerostris darwini]|uniref:Uncharacterized protein n=1 Tax=Caerostris darwini TaxID=1538125 RepID=A0AAV4X5Y9_9ARAC|nr:hypothetical protein CDAR_58991 [Caerostris darwini]